MRSVLEAGAYQTIERFEVTSANVVPELESIRIRGGSRGRVRGCAPLPEMTCGFLIQMVLCKKKKELCGLLVLK